MPNQVIAPPHVWHSFEKEEMTTEDRVLFYMRKYKQPMTPSEMNSTFFSGKACINSIRSAMTRLSTCKRPKLEMTQLTTTGTWDKPEHYWKLK